MGVLIIGLTFTGTKPFNSVMLIINPRRMREGYGNRSVCECVCVSVTITPLVINILYETCTIVFSTHRAINLCQKLNFFEKSPMVLFLIAGHIYSEGRYGISLLT